MVATSNWAIFAKKTEIMWSFGNLTEEFLNNTMNFLNGLDSMGTELFGSGVASIVLDQKSNRVVSASEIFVVSLANTFFFIASDPLITIRLIYQKELPDILEDQMRSVLIGQASVLYANLYTNSTGKEAQIDDLFWTALREIGYTKDLKEIVDRGVCSFRNFTLPDMLLFHYQLRKIFAEKYLLKIDPWVIIADESGPIHLKYGKMSNANSLAGYLSVLYMFCRELFDSSPKSIVFGGDTLIPLEVVTGNEYYLSITRWDVLFNDKEFLKVFETLDPTIINQLKTALTEFLGEKLALIMKEELRTWTVPQLIRAYERFPNFLEQLNA